MRLGFVCMLLLVLGLLIGCGATSGGNQAGGEQKGEQCEGYPARDIDFVVPYDPGGGYDNWARLVAPFIEEHLPGDAKVVVRNNPGAGGLAAARELYTAQPDGMQIQIMDAKTIVAAQLSGEADINASDYVYLGRLTSDPRVMFSSADSDINTVEDLKEAEPTKASITGYTSGDGVDTAILYEALEIEYTPVLHNEGGGAQRLSVIRGDTDAGISSLESVLGDLESGDLRPILYMGSEKPAEGEPGYEEVSDTQTIADLGFPELGEALQSQRVIATTPDTPDCIRDVLAQAFQDAVNDPEFLSQLEENELILHSLSAEETSESVNKQLETLSEYESTLKEAINQASVNRAARNTL